MCDGPRVDALVSGATVLIQCGVVPLSSWASSQCRGERSTVVPVGQVRRRGNHVERRGPAAFAQRRPLAFPIAASGIRAFPEHPCAAAKTAQPGGPTQYWFQ